MKTKLTQEQYEGMVKYLYECQTIDKLEDILENNRYYLTKEEISTMVQIKNQVLQRHHTRHEESVEEF